MSSVAESVPSEQPIQAPASTAPSIPWVALAWFAALVGLCYAPVISQLVGQWNSDPDMGHGFFVPAIAAYIAWQQRERLLARSYRPNYWGLLVVGFAAVQLLIATLGAELFLARTAIIETVLGIVLVLGGMSLVRELAFPLFLLCFMVPLPTVIYNQITLPLQNFASSVAEVALSLLGIPVLRDGNVLELASQKLSVVEACSGIRSLLSLSFLSLVYSYFFDNKKWMRVVLLIATVPIAIAANAFRVTLTGILSEINPELAHGFMHTASGWVIFMIALVILVGVHLAINKIYYFRAEALRRGAIA